MNNNGIRGIVIKLRKKIRLDIAANKNNLKGQLVVVLYRIAHESRKPLGKRPSLPSMLIGAFYRLGVEWILGVEIPWATRIGVPLRIHHGVGIVINDQSVIGNNVVIRQNVTIGNKGTLGPCPVIEDDVDIGANAVILGGVRLGAGASIGAGAVVTKDVPAGFIAVGNPANVRAPRGAA